MAEKHKQSRKIKKDKLIVDPVSNKMQFVDHVKFLFISQRYSLTSSSPENVFNIAFLTDTNKFQTFYFRDYQKENKALKYFLEVCKDHHIDNKTEVIFNEVNEKSFIRILFNIIERCTGNYHNNISLGKMLSTINRYYKHSIFPKFKNDHDFFKKMSKLQLDNALIDTFYYVKDSGECPWANESQVIRLCKNVKKKYKKKAEKNIMLLCIGVFYMAVRKYYRNLEKKSAFKNTQLQR